MGKVISMMTRPLRNFNVESRAHKIISKDKPTPAPKHKSDQLEYERMMNEYPEVFEEGQKKHKGLDTFLKDVYIKSHDPASSQSIQSNPERPLPLDRKQVMDFEFGVKEPEQVPVGKTTLKRALQFITDHHTHPQIHTIKKISQDYSLPEETTRNILKYFKVYEIYIPQQRKTKAKFAGPSVPRFKIIKQPPKLLVGKDDKGETQG